MEEAAQTEDLRRSPAEEARVGHAKRVAMWCAELAQVFALGPEDLRLLQRAALLHQYPELVLNDAAVSRLLTDMGIAEPPRSAADRDLLHLLAVHARRRPGSDAHMARLAAILEMCDAFDETFEAEALAPVQDGENAGYDARNAVCALLQSSCRADLLNAMARLPVFPAVAQRALVLLTSEDCSFGVIEKLVASDAVLAGHIIAAANSALAGGSTPVNTIRAALVRVGLVTARRVVLSASLRPMFASRRLQRLWNHSLETADMAASLARRSGAVDDEQAFLAGLVHDIGQLTFFRLPADAASRYARLLDASCPNILAETALFGQTHAELAREALTRWRFPESIVLAVANHHTPEKTDSAIASLLYLAEECTDSAEHLPSAFRLAHACEAVGLQFNDIVGLRTSPGPLEALRFAVQQAQP